jgi:IS6 family transposase
VIRRRRPESLSFVGFRFPPGVILLAVRWYLRYGLSYRDVEAATRFFETLLAGRERPREITTDLAAPLLRVVDELLPDALHDTTQYANNRIECVHGRFKARLRPMRGLRTDRTATVVIRGNAFIQNLPRGH